MLTSAREFFKQFFLFASALLLLKIGVAQQLHEIRASVGIGSGYFIARQLADEGFLFTGGSVFSTQKRELVKYMEYAFEINKRISVGIAGSYNSFTFLDSYPENGEGTTYDYSQTTLTILVRRYYSKNATKFCRFYGSTNFGISFKTKEISNNYPGYGTLSDGIRSYSLFAAHITAIGISAGKRIGGYAELGWGFKGIINAGIFFKP